MFSTRYLLRLDQTDLIHADKINKNFNIQHQIKAYQLQIIIKTSTICYRGLTRVCCDMFECRSQNTKNNVNRQMRF